MYVPETTLRAALASRGLALRSIRVVPHVSLAGYNALVCCCEGKGSRFSVYTNLDLRGEDWATWVSINCDACLATAGDGAAVADGDQVRAVGSGVEC